MRLGMVLLGVALTFVCGFLPALGVGGAYNSLFVAGSIAGTGLWVFAIFLRPGRAILRNGRDATATVLAVADTGITVNNDPVVRLRLQVAPADGSPPYEAQVRKRVSRLAIPGAGDQVRVRYLPSKPAKVAIADDASFVSPRPTAAGFPGAYGVTGPAFQGAQRVDVTGAAGVPGAYNVNDELARLTSLLQSGQITAQQNGDYNVAAELARLTSLLQSGKITAQQYRAYNVAADEPASLSSLLQSGKITAQEYEDIRNILSRWMQ